MTFEEIERHAIRREFPAGNALPELECYSCLAALYDGYRRGRIDREAAGKQKAAIHRQYDRAVEEYDRRAEAYRRMQQNIRAASERWDALPKRAAMMDKDELISELLDIVSTMVGENVTAAAVRKGIENGHTGASVSGGDLPNQSGAAFG